MKHLNSFIHDWTIRVKVITKASREWSNANGSGTLMNVDLMDEYGTMIQGTFFKEMALKYNEILQEGKVYVMSGGTVKLQQKKFTSIPHECAITFNEYS